MKMSKVLKASVELHKVRVMGQLLTVEFEMNFVYRKVQSVM